MPQWLQDLITGWPMIRANLPTFLVILVLMVGVVWYLFGQVYNQRLADRDSVISNKESEIALLKSQRDDYKDKLGGASPDQAKARIDTLEARLSKLEPRRLTASQQEELTRKLQLPAGLTPLVQIYQESSCFDCHILAENFVAAFSANPGWVVRNQVLMGGPHTVPSGIGVAFFDPNSTESKIVVDALRAAGLRFDRQPNLGNPQPHLPAVIPNPVIQITFTNAAPQP
ncbi:hypothetical protein G8O24_12800 [Bradyrhizobium sp. INPA01-394B]|uniref:Uncharacterized protein n=1 Tax=Bradyrhizobium campsiandrae TaxID=1729892 RepID=A0ABR7UAF6_9BRAD|nr:hypothetical protein [Bradyrhizobium campsiandrae]MBC9878221.1 hypothetical protein [Bradyrhizobium campsiandrae]MBC9980556.1 hypothetical protein [Bradyrhizobium campsiandrae]